MARPSADPAQGPHAQAVFRQKLKNLGQEKFLKLTDKAIKEAVNVSAGSRLAMVSDIWKQIDKGLAKGEDLAAFKIRLKKKIGKDWASADSARLEAIYFEVSQRYYNAGRMAEMLEPGNLAERPYFKFVAVLDTRTSQICKRCSGTVARADTKWIKTHTPPLHFRCRSTLVALTVKQAQKDGVTKNPTKLKPQEGFGDLEAYKPKLADVPRPVAKVYKAKRNLRAPKKRT